MATTPADPAPARTREVLPVRIALRLIAHTVWRVPHRVRRRVLRLPGARALQRVLYARFGERIVDVPERSFAMRIDLRDPDQRAHFRTPHVERHVVEYLASTLAPGDVAFDAGAFCGYYALLMGRVVGPTGSVVAFEPVPENVRRIEANVRLNGLGDVVAVEGAAVSAHSGKASLSVAGPRSSLAKERPWRPSLDVRTTSVDAYVRERGVERLDLVKVDVEGSELDVLEGARETLRALGPALVVEVFTDEEEAGVTAFLDEQDYRHRVLGEVFHGRHLVAVPRRNRGDGPGRLTTTQSRS